MKQFCFSLSGLRHVIQTPLRQFQATASQAGVPKPGGGIYPPNRLSMVYICIPPNNLTLVRIWA